MCENLHSVVPWCSSPQNLLCYPEVSLKVSSLTCTNVTIHVQLWDLGQMEQMIWRMGQGKREKRLLAWILGPGEPFLSGGREKSEWGHEGPCTVPLCHTWEQGLEKWFDVFIWCEVSYSSESNNTVPIKQNSQAGPPTCLLPKKGGDLISETLLSALHKWRIHSLCELCKLFLDFPSPTHLLL